MTTLGTLCTYLLNNAFIFKKDKNCFIFFSTHEEHNIFGYLGYLYLMIAVYFPHFDNVKLKYFLLAKKKTKLTDIAA